MLAGFFHVNSRVWVSSASRHHMNSCVVASFVTGHHVNSHVVVVSGTGHHMNSYVVVVRNSCVSDPALLACAESCGRKSKTHFCQLAFAPSDLAQDRPGFRHYTPCE